MKKLDTYRNIFIFVFIISILIASLFNDIDIDYGNVQAKTITFPELLKNNFFASIKYLIPFVNIVLLFGEVLYNAIIIMNVSKVDSKMLFKVIFHFPFEVTAVYCCYMISYMVILNKLEKIKKWIIIYLIALVIGAYIEIYISGRLF